MYQVTLEDLGVKEIALAYSASSKSSVLPDIKMFSYAELIDNVLDLKRPVGQRLLDQFGGLVGLMKADVAELVGVCGLKSKQAILLKSAIHLGMQAQLESKNVIGKIIASPNDVVDYIRESLRWDEVERLFLIGLDTKNQVLFSETVSVGSLNSSIVHPREIFNIAIKRRCASIILAHPHPSGDPTPSNEDIQVTRRVVEAGQLLGIEVLDHVIVGDKKHCSLKEQGKM